MQADFQVIGEGGVGGQMWSPVSKKPLKRTYVNLLGLTPYMGPFEDDILVDEETKIQNQHQTSSSSKPRLDLSLNILAHSRRILLSLNFFPMNDMVTVNHIFFPKNCISFT